MCLFVLRTDTGAEPLLAMDARVVAPLYSRITVIALVMLGKINAGRSMQRYRTEEGHSSKSEDDNHADT
jgi:hypothetical protein